MESVLGKVDKERVHGSDSFLSHSLSRSHSATNTLRCSLSATYTLPLTVSHSLTPLSFTHPPSLSLTLPLVHSPSPLSLTLPQPHSPSRFERALEQAYSRMRGRQELASGDREGRIADLAEFDQSLEDRRGAFLGDTKLRQEA